MNEQAYERSRRRPGMGRIGRGRFLGRLKPRWLLMLSFAAAIVVGTLLLKIPFATAPGKATSWLDALFTATSSVCVTGLVVVDTGLHFSLFGQLIVLVLLQIGGLGIMTLTTFLLLLLGKRFTLHDRAILRESVTQLPVRDVKGLLKTIVRFTLYAEGIGAFLLFIRFLFHFLTPARMAWYLAVPKALYFAVFHAVSAFCNAGFSPYPQSLMDFRSDPTMNVVMCALILVGGLGFLAVRDFSHRLRAPHTGGPRPRLMLHTRVVLVTSLCLLAAGALVCYGLEVNHARGHPGAGVSPMAAVFLSVTARTAGFNTVDTKLLSDATKLIVIFLMFVGASPGSCGGGVKTSTFAVGFAMIASRLRGREHTQIGRRTIPSDTVVKALATLTACFILVVIVALLLTISEDRPGEQTPRFINLLFETTSAFGTVGLSAGITPTLSALGKALIVFTMFAGRIGPLTLILAFSTRASAVKLKYPEENVLIG